MTIGIVGAGQLGQMLALAGYPLGLDFLFFDRSADTPAGRIAPLLAGRISRRGAARRARPAQRRHQLRLGKHQRRGAAPGGARHPHRAAAQGPGRGAGSARREALLSSAWRSRPRASRRSTAAQRWRAQCSASVCPEFSRPGASATTARASTCCAAAPTSTPAWDALGSAPLLYEEFVPFDYEVSIIGVRARAGAIAVYPLNRNYHVDGILRLTLAPWTAPALARAAQRSLTKVLEHFNYVGVLTIEFFVHRGRLLANEMAPRVHNSGHWTIEGAVTSQFENHVRAIAGLPLGATARARPFGNDQSDRNHACGAPVSGRARPALARLPQGTTSRPKTRPLHR